MKHRYYFCQQYDLRLVQYLEKNNVKYKIVGEHTILPMITFDICDTFVDTKRCLKELEEMKVKLPIVYVEYSKSEIENAELLVLSTQKQCINILNEQEAYDYSCKWVNAFGISKVNHKEQKNLFKIRKEPACNSRTAFWSEDTGKAEVFVDFRVHKLIEDNCLKGISLKNVILPSGEYSENLYQLTAENTLNRNQISMGYGERKEICSLCKKEQFFIDNVYQLHLDFSKIEKKDFYVTERMWGEGIAYPIYIVSQKFYQLLKENKLSGNLKFSPIVDVSKGVQE